METELENITIISDQEKGLQGAVGLLFPHAEHRVCMRHLWKNFKKTYPGEFFERVVWDAARANNLVDYCRSIAELRTTSEEAAVELEATYTVNGYYWSRSLFSPVCKNNYIVNNLSESFNAWVLEARYMPCVELVDQIRIKIMEKMNERRKLAAKWKGVLVPLADRYVKELSKNLGGWHVRRSDDRIAEVDCMEKREVLDMVMRTCTCRKWQLTGLPCKHAGEVIGEMRNARWEDFVDECFYISR